MNKKKSVNPTQSLSPENYIRQRSKNLLVYKCLINKDWEKEKLCDIFIIRQHVNGNVTVCMYLVDLLCLGVKDTFFHFNIPYRDIERMTSRAETGSDFIEVPYELAHNILFAGLEFAEEYGFKPHKDFTSITSYFLEDDDENIPFIDIECGDDDGIPLYVNAGYETPARAGQIITQLRNTAGEGNFHYISRIDGDEEFDDEDDEEFDDEDAKELKEENRLIAEIALWDKDIQKKTFIELSKKEKSRKRLSEDESKRLLILTAILLFDMVDKDAVDSQLEIWEKKFDHKFVDEAELPNTLFPNIQSADSEKLAERFFDILNKALTRKNPKALIEEWRPETGDAPVLSYLEFLYLVHNNKKNHMEKLDEAYRKFPNYFLFRLYHHAFTHEKEPDLNYFEKIFAEQKLPITEYEAELFFSWYIIFFMSDVQADLTSVLALELFVYNNLDFFSEDTNFRILAIFHEYKIKILTNHFSGNK